MVNVVAWFLLIYSLYANCIQIFFKPALLCPLLSTIWVPQIILNTFNGTKDTPGNQYMLITSLYLLFVPLSIHLNQSNLFLYKSSYLAGFLLAFVMALQVSVLCMQSRRPRFLIPVAWRQAFIRYYMEERGVYVYERMFEDEAKMSNLSFLSSF